jgi:ceramide glucosyltransferase
MRSSRFGGYLGLVVTFGLWWTVVWAVASLGSMAALVVIAVVLALRWTLLGVYASALGDRYAATSWWLLPLRDVIGPLVWLSSIGGSKIVWRGEEFRLQAGKLERL